MSAAVSRSCAVATLVVVALWLAGTARAQGSDWPAPLPAQASAQQATTRQAGITKADAAEAQPTNIFVSLRVDSPGDNGPVTQTSTTAVAADSKNAAATAQKTEQAETGGGSVAPAPVPTSAPTSAAPPPGAVAERPAAASAPPANCVRVAPGAPTRIVITIGEACHDVAPKRAAAATEKHEKPVQAAAPAPTAPVAPVVHAAPALSPGQPTSTPPRVAAKPRPAPAAHRPRAAESKSLDPLAASTKVADLVAAASLPRDGESRYALMLALLLAMLGTAALWSYGGIHRHRFWRWR